MKTLKGDLSKIFVSFILDTAGKDAGGNLCQPEAGAHLWQLEMSAGIFPALMSAGFQPAMPLCLLVNFRAKQ